MSALTVKGSPFGAVEALDRASVRERVRGTILERIGDTPLVPLRRLGADCRAELWAKVEGANPGGSVKDRPALWMVLAAEVGGLLEPPRSRASREPLGSLATRNQGAALSEGSGGPGHAGARAILDATSGNTGVALAMIGAARGHRVVLCMPDKVSVERKRVARAFGAHVILTDPLQGSDGAILEARRLVAEHPDRYVYVDQYANPANPRAHYETTGPEIWEQTDGRVTHFVAGVGTSGTVVGAGAYLRERGVRVVAVQPDQPFHGLEGLKHMATAIRPPIWDESAADEHTTCSTDEAVALMKRLAREEGLFCGPSTGAALVIALRVARRIDGVVVALLPDGGARYLSTPLWE